MAEVSIASTEESFAQLLESTFSQQFVRPDTLVRGKVARIEKDHVIVDVNLKSEGLIPIEQFHDLQGGLEVQVGDQVDVVVEALEDGFGETRLSREKAKRVQAWEDLQRSYDQQTPVQGVVTGRVKGGFTVELGAIRGFLPGSLVDVRPVRDASGIEGNELSFKVIKLDPKRNNIILSRRAILEEEGQAGRELLLASLSENQVISGVVKNIADYGAFIDLGGIDGLLHVTDISWKRIKHPSEVLSLGDEIKVIILRVDQERGRVSLGLKQLTGDPWGNVDGRYQTGTRLMGRVTNITDYGCFVELEEGIEGLVHISEMDWTNKNINPHKVVQLDAVVEVMVLEANASRRRISLGIKQCCQNPWILFADKHAIGEKISGKIRSITDFGLFIGLEEGVDGLVHLSDISWRESGEEAIRRYKKGDTVEAVILAIEPQRERISLGIKQLEGDPRAQVLEKYPVGTLVKGRILERNSQGIRIDLGDSIEGYIAKSADINNEDFTSLDQRNPGEEIEVFVVGISSDRKDCLIELSVTKEETEEKGNKEEAEV